MVKIKNLFKRVGFVAMIAAAGCVVAYILLMIWIASNDRTGMLYYTPGIVSFVVFCYAVLRLVHPVEDFFQIKRSSVDVHSSTFAYLIIIVITLAVNLLFIALAYARTKDASFSETMNGFYYMNNDIQHYLDIAEKWYVNDSTDHQYLIVFFPLYPILLRVAYVVVHNLLLCGIIVSNIFAILSGVMFYKLTTLLLPRCRRIHALLLLYAFPAAYFFFVPMTESLFLFLSIACIYFTIRRDHAVAFLCAVLCTLTRMQGVLLFVPMLMEIIYSLRKDYLLQELKGGKKEIVKRFLPLLGPIVGMLIYLVLNKLYYGEFFKFLEFQSDHWSQGFTFFWDTASYLVDYLKIWFDSGQIDYLTGITIPGVITLVLMLIMLVYGAKRLRPSLMLYTLAYFVMSFGATWLLSAPRYMACAFPLAFIAEEMGCRKRWRRNLIYAVYLVMYILYFHLFLTTGSVY